MSVWICEQKFRREKKKIMLSNLSLSSKYEAVWTSSHGSSIYHDAESLKYHPKLFSAYIIYIHNKIYHTLSSFRRKVLNYNLGSLGSGKVHNLSNFSKRSWKILYTCKKRPNRLGAWCHIFYQFASNSCIAKLPPKYKDNVQFSSMGLKGFLKAGDQQITTYRWFSARKT